jgi:hypothetical protein
MTFRELLEFELMSLGNIVVKAKNLLGVFDGENE